MEALLQVVGTAFSQLPPANGITAVLGCLSLALVLFCQYLVNLMRIKQTVKHIPGPPVANFIAGKAAVLLLLSPRACIYQPQPVSRNACTLKICHVITTPMCLGIVYLAIMMDITLAYNQCMSQSLLCIMWQLHVKMEYEHLTVAAHYPAWSMLFLLTEMTKPAGVGARCEAVHYVSLQAMPLTL